VKRSTIMAIAAILATVFGLGFILAPGQTVSPYGITLETDGQWIGRYLGAAFVGIGVLTWLARKIEPSEGLRAIMLGAFVMDVLGLVGAILHTISGRGNALLWSDVVIYLFLAVGFGYFRFREPARS
jgi:hypothetical protein